MKLRSTGASLFAILLMAASAAAQEAPEIPRDLQETYGAFATALVEGRADDAIEFYAEDAVVLVDSEHVYRGRSAILEGFLRAYLEAPAGEDGPETEIRVDGVVVGEGVVTLAGRYTNPAGAAGIYGNTWERQDDGSWKLTISVMTFEAGDGARAAGRARQGFACTQVLGLSQSLEWFGGLSLETIADGAGSAKLPGLKQGDFLPAWQGRFYPGASVEDWMDPEHPGWFGPSARARETPAHCPREEVERVVFNVSGAPRSPDAWAEAVDSVAAVVRAKFPAVRRVVMQPVVGAPEGECRDVRAARNHPGIAEGIRRAAGRGAVTAGPEPKVAACDQFRDALGHLTEEGAERVRAVLRDHYRP